MSPSTPRRSTYWRKQIQQFWRSLPPSEAVEKFWRSLSLEQFRGPGGWLLALTVFVALWMWNWKLVLSTLVGVLVLMGVFVAQDWDWRAGWLAIRRSLQGVNRQLVVAVVSGLIATSGTYIGAALWTDLESPWLALAVILQGLATLTVMGLLLGQLWLTEAKSSESQWQQSVADLTHADPLKRLIAVHQVTDLAKQLPESSQTQAMSYLQVLLSRETDVPVRDAVLEGLQALTQPPSLDESRPKVNIPPLEQKQPLRQPLV